MYSILVRLRNCECRNPKTSAIRWKYLRNDDGSVYTEDDLLKVQDKFEELLNDHLFSDIQVIKNYIIHEDITIEEVV